jgi:hypothetical protein
MFQSVLLLSRLCRRDCWLLVQHVGLFGPRRRRALETPPESPIRLRGNTRMRAPSRGNRFAALLMTAFAILCGTTAAMLSHRDHFADRAIGIVDDAETAGTRLEGFPTARALAAAVVDALDTRAGGGGAFRVVDDTRASYTQPIIVTATKNGREHHVRFDPETGEAMIHSKTSAGARPRNWPARGRIVLADQPNERLVRGVTALLAKRGIQSESVVLRSHPDLDFTFESEGRRWRAAYNIQTGAISAQPEDDSDDALSSE